MVENNLKPHGREEVAEALIKAAAELFSKHGVKAVSIRDIASLAGVNHGLIHRHFGTKEQLRIKTQEYLAKQVRDEIGEPGNMMDALLLAGQAIRNKPLFWKVMARTFLDDNFEGDVQTSYPMIRKLVDFVRDGQKNGLISADMDPRHIVAAICAYGLGMQVFEKYIVQGTGLEDVPFEEVQSTIQNHFMSSLLSGKAHARSSEPSESNSDHCHE